MNEQPYPAGAVVLSRQTADGQERVREGIVDIGRGLVSMENRNMRIVWAYWRNPGGRWEKSLTWVRATIVEPHPDPDPVLASFVATRLA